MVIDKEKNDLFFIMEGDDKYVNVIFETLKDLLILKKITNKELSLKGDKYVIKVPFEHATINFTCVEKIVCNKVDIFIERHHRII